MKIYIYIHNSSRRPQGIDYMTRIRVAEWNNNLSSEFDDTHTTLIKVLYKLKISLALGV